MATKTYAPIVRHDGLPDRVKGQLLDMITAGELRPGDQLPPERQLAAQLGVSRNVLREALGRLASMNVLDVRHGAGVFVAPLDVESLIEPLEFIVSFEQAALRYLVDARLVIEPGTAALAAQNASDEDLAALHELVAVSERHTDEPERFLQIDLELHGRIVRMAANPFITRIMDSIGKLGRSSREFTNASQRMRRTAFHDHQEIVRALAARDPVAASEVMREHLEHVRDEIVAPSADEQEAT